MTTDESEKNSLIVTNRVLRLPPRGNVIHLCFLLFVVVVWVFLPSLHGDLLFADESAYIVHNPHVNTGFSWANFAWAFYSLDYGNWHPVTWMSHILDCQFYGLKPWGHHLTNILLHASNTVLVFLVLRRMTGALWRSLMVALLFSLHPLRVQSVAWISERRDVLSLFFWMLTLWAYVRYTEETRRQGRRTKNFYGLMLLFFVLGLMSKTMLVTLPFVLLLLDYWPLERWQQKSWWHLVVEKLPLFLLTIVVSTITYMAQQAGAMMQEMADLPLSDRVGNALISYGRYLGKFFWPANLCGFYPHPGHWPMTKVLLAGLFLLSVSMLVWVIRRRKPYLLVGWLWYLGTLVPVIGLVQLCSQSMADRYTYIPMIGVTLFVAWGLKDLTERWRHRSVFFAVVTAAAAVACATRTRNEIPYYKDDATLWSRAVAVTENNHIAHCTLGVVFGLTSNGDRALKEFQEAVRLKPDYVLAQRHLGEELQKRRLFTEAINHYQIVLDLSPKDGETWNNSGVAILRLGRVDDAIAHFRKSVEYEPNNEIYQKNLGNALLIKPQANEANVKLREALKLQPDQPNILNNLAWLLATTLDANIRNGDEAVQLAARACELTHYQTTIYVGTLATAYAEAGRFEEAITTAQLACSLASKAGEQTLLQKNQELLALFREHLPYHEITDYKIIEIPSRPAP